MRSERKQEIAKAKLKKAQQQLNTQANPNQVQPGGNVPQNASVPPAPTATTPPTVTPPPANVPRKVQVGRLARAAKPKPSLPAAAVGPRKVAPTKPPLAKGKIKNLPAPAGVTAAELEDNTAALVDAEYDTDELAELPTESEPEVVESELVEENDQAGEQ